MVVTRVYRWLQAFPDVHVIPAISMGRRGQVSHFTGCEIPVPHCMLVHSKGEYEGHSVCAAYRSVCRYLPAFAVTVCVVAEKFQLFFLHE